MAGIPLQGSFIQGSPVSGGSLQGGSGGGIALQGSSPTVQAGAGSGLQVQPAAQQSLQVTANPQNLIDPTANSTVSGPSTTPAIDPAAAQAAAQAAQQAAQASALRSQITDLANQVKSIYNGRYGGVDASAGEQEGKLNDRFKTESGDLERQIGQQNEDTGAAFAGNGVYDSSYRGNAQDRITQAGNVQIGALGDELQNNLATIAQWVQQQKAGFDAGKNSMDTLVSHLADETNPSNLITLRNQIDSQIAQLQSQGADNNTEAQNMSALEQIAPSTPRAQQLQTTLQSILGGNASPTTKAALGSQLIASAQLPAADQKQLSDAFNADIAAAAQGNQQQQPQVA